MQSRTYLYDINEQVCEIYFNPDSTQLYTLETLLQDSNQVVACDTETEGLIIKHDKIRLVQFGIPSQAWVIPYEGNEEYIKRLFDMRQCVLVFHNAIFDVLQLWFNDVLFPLNNVRDTRILSHEWNNRRRHNLEGLINDFISEDIAKNIKGSVGLWVKEYNNTLDKGEKKLTHATVYKDIPLDWPSYVIYAGMDVLATSRLYYMLKELVEKSVIHPTELIETDHIDLYNCIEMSYRKVPINVEATLAAQEQYSKNIAEVEARIAPHIDKYRSTKELPKVLLERGHKLTERTDKGGIKVNEQVLAPLAKIDSLVRDILTAKRLNKWKKTYIDKVLEHVVNGGVPAQFFPLGAETGRYSCNSPNFQNFPSDNSIRGLIEVPRGYTIVSIDYSGQEGRLAAALSSDPQLIEDFKNVSFNKSMAEKIFGLGYTQEQYTLGKNIFYGWLYMGGAKKLSAQTGVPIDKVKEITDKLTKIYPVYTAYAKQCLEQVALRGYVTGITGRPMLVNKSTAYQAANTRAQNGGRELLAKAVRDICETEYKETIIALIHDEILLKVREDRLDETIQAITKAMETTINGVHFPVSAQVCGQNWRAH